MKKKLLILGIGGLTGSKLALLAKNDFEVFGTYYLRDPKFDFIKSMKLNIIEIQNVREMIEKIKPDILINCIAINSVDYCENHTNDAKKINVDLVKEIFEITNSIGTKFVHLSSDSVFDGLKDSPYVEEDIPNPINFYGRTKMLGEQIVLKNPYSLVVRASVLYGWLPKYLSDLPSSSMKPTNFGQWLINKLQSNEKVKIITDEYSSPIIADDFAKSILHLIKNDKSGIFHSSPTIRITRYDFSIQLAKYLRLNYGLIEPTTNKDLKRIVTTGFNKCLDSSKIIKETAYRFLTLEDSFNLLSEQMKT